ncbi:MAG TPA: hypothetical protein VIZ68_05200, partial [Thermoplasmata archaeon]
VVRKAHLPRVESRSMNRSQPCEVCGCPTLFHTPRPSGDGGPRRMVCEECSRTKHAEQVCGSEVD